MKKASEIVFILAKHMLGKVSCALMLTVLITLCARPVSATQFAYVTNRDSNTVSVIDIATNSVVDSIPVGTSPLDVAFTPSGAFAYVTNWGSGNVSVIATATNSVVNTIAVGENPFGVAITPDGAFAYVTSSINFGSGNVSVIATATNSVVNTIAVGENPLGVAITPDGTFAYVANFHSGTLSVIETATNSVVASFRAGGSWMPISGGVAMPFSVAITPDGAFTYVTNYGKLHTNSGFSVTETTTNSVVGTYWWSQYGNARGVAISPDGAFAYVAYYHGHYEPRGNWLVIIDTATNSVVTTVPVEGSPVEVAITPDGTFAYVTISDSNTVSVIDTATHSVVDSIPVGVFPYGVAIAPSSDLCGETLKTSCNYKLTLEQNTQKTDSIQFFNAGNVSRSATLEVLNPHSALSVSLTSQDSITVAPGETRIVPITIDPGSLSTGKYDGILLKVDVDDGSTLYSNITVYVTPPGAAVLPDLTVNAEDISFISTDSGETVTYIATIHNRGNSPASDVNVQFYEFGNLLGETVLNEVPAEGIGTASIAAPITTSGEHLIQIVVDFSNAVEELDENNNEASQIIKSGFPSPIPGNILVTGSLPSTVYTDNLFTISSRAVYDIYVDGTRYTNYAVKGGAVQITIKDETDNEWLYGGVHTNVNGYFSKTVQAPVLPGNYKIIITVTDNTFTGRRELRFSVTERPATPPPPPLPPTISGSGTWTYLPSGTWNWTWTQFPENEPTPQSDLRVYSENIHFSNNNPAPEEEITIFAEILYWASSTDLVAQYVPVNFYVTYPGTPKMKIGETVIDGISVGAPDFGSRYVYTTWKNRQQGIYIVEAEINPGYAEENQRNNAATRAIIVGQLQSQHGAIQGQVIGPWGGVGEVIIELHDSSTSSLIGSTLTDNNTGHYHFESLPVGDYQVHIVTPGQHQADAETKQTEVTDQEISVVNFCLKEIDSFCGDLDHDGDVDGEDRNILRGAFSTSFGDTGFIEEADYDEDGNIDFSDYQIWYACYKDFIAK